jgi:Glycosyltransferase
MRVLMVSSLWPPEVLGGAELYASALAERLQADGHVVGAVTLGVGGEDVVAQVPSWPYRMQDFGSQPASRRALFHAADLARPDTGRILDRAFEEFRPDVVHSHVVQGMSARVLTRPARRGIGHVHTLHDYWLLCQRNSMVKRDDTACATRCSSCRVISATRSRQIASRAPDVMVAVSEAIARPHLAELPWMRGRTRVIYNPVEEAQPRASRREGAPLTFGFVGRLGADKGVITLLRAYQRAALGDARLVIAGRGAEAATVEAAAGVEFRGWVSGAEKAALLDEIDCLIVPSQWADPAPLVVNEARSRGLAVIGSTAGGIPELVAPECEPLLVTPADVDALAAAMERFAHAPAEFRPTPEARPLDWPGHLLAITTAYSDAMNAVRATERGREVVDPGLPLTDARGSISPSARGGFRDR